MGTGQPATGPVLINKEAKVGRALKQAGMTMILFGALVVAGCTSVPRLEPSHATRHHPKAARATTAPKPVRHRKIVARKLPKPVQDETAPVITPLGGGGNGGGNGGGGGGGW